MVKHTNKAMTLIDFYWILEPEQNKQVSQITLCTIIWSCAETLAK